jgi:hypothetical protein
VPSAFCGVVQSRAVGNGDDVNRSAEFDAWGDMARNTAVLTAG